MGLPPGSGAVLDRSTWPEPRVFAEIQRLGAVDDGEMDRVFNRGIGMLLVVDPAAGDDVLDVLDSAGQHGGAIIGSVVAGESPGVRFA